MKLDDEDEKNPNSRKMEFENEKPAEMPPKMITVLLHKQNKLFNECETSLINPL